MSKKCNDRVKFLEKENSELKAIAKTLKDSIHEAIKFIEGIKTDDAEELHRRQGGRDD